MKETAGGERRVGRARRSAKAVEFPAEGQAPPAHRSLVANASRVWLPHVGFLLLWLTLGLTALSQQFPSGPGDPTCPDDFKSAAALKVVPLFAPAVTITGLVDNHTRVGRSDPFLESAPPDLGSLICGAGAPPFLNTVPLVSDADLCRRPLDWPEGDPARREVHTEILSFDLASAGGVHKHTDSSPAQRSVPAGWQQANAYQL